MCGLSNVLLVRVFDIINNIWEKLKLFLVIRPLNHIFVHGILIVRR